MRTPGITGSGASGHADIDSGNRCAGMLWIHSAPAALQSHLDWALARLALPCGGRAIWCTRPESVQPTVSHYGQHTLICTEIEWTAVSADVDALLEDLSRWPSIIFEMTVDSSDALFSQSQGGSAAAGVNNRTTLNNRHNGHTGMRYMRTPELGLFSAVTDAAGNILLNERRLRALVARSIGRSNQEGFIVTNEAPSLSLECAIDEALGGPWDRAIEPLRAGTAGYDMSSIAEAANAAVVGGAEFSEQDTDADNVVMFHPRRAVM